MRLYVVANLIEQSRQRVAVVVNAQLGELYWSIGKAIQKDILQHKRAGYGEQVIQSLSEKLIAKFGSGWSTRQLWNCVRSADTFSQKAIVSALRAQLSWTHLRILMAIENSTQREFYLEMCKMERWSTRQLQERIDAMLFERTAISKKPDKLIRRELKKLKAKKTLSPDLVFRDPYFLNFLNLKDAFSEEDLETALITAIRDFILELGSDFAFLAQQKRITIDREDYHLDLLFFHRKLHRLIAIDLKLGKFRPADKAQMELYLNWLNRYERSGGEENPLGLILCADKSEEHIELLSLNKGNIRVAQYLTELPPKKLLQKKLHEAMEIARARFNEADNFTEVKR